MKHLLWLKKIARDGKIQFYRYYVIMIMHEDISLFRIVYIYLYLIIYSIQLGKFEYLPSTRRRKNYLLDPPHLINTA